MHRIDKIAETYHQLQQEIIRGIEDADGLGNFSNDQWSTELGSGVTSVLQEGAVIEKGAVNFSFVKGNFTGRMEKILGEKARSYAATGISSILHPENPWVPIIHMNVRYFTLDNGTAWFGGGIDLTPHIVESADALLFHQSLKEVCDRFDANFYLEFKKWADDYFFLPHRQETRGVGGIFFDRVKPINEEDFEKLFRFTVSLAELYPVIYASFMKKNGRRSCTAREKKWQALRRGRYVEFNLLYDRGTKFGMESGGNTESILVSLPANASWEYNFNPEAGSFEEKTLQMLRKDIDWINFSQNS
jgi:coproporphyrinogen III oxidase